MLQIWLLLSISINYKIQHRNDRNVYSFILYNFIVYMQFNIKLIEMYLLHWHYSITDNFDLPISPINVLFDEFVIESQNDVLVLHLKDGFASFVLLQLRPRIFCEFGIFLRWVDCKFSNFGPRKIYSLTYDAQLGCCRRCVHPWSTCLKPLNSNIVSWVKLLQALQLGWWTAVLFIVCHVDTLVISR